MNNIYDNKNNVIGPTIKNLDGAILACFTRSYDNHHKNNLHLITSIFYKENLKEEELRKYHDNVMKLTKTNEIIYVFIVDLEERDVEYEMRVNYERFKLININLANLTGYLNIPRKENSLFERIFGKTTLKTKDFDNLYQNSLFIFRGIMWSSVVLSFRMNGVNISGGSISTRHILSSVNFQLLMNLFYFEIDPTMIKKMTYDSSKLSILSNTIPLDLLGNLELIYKDLDHLKGFNYKKISQYIKDKYFINYPEQGNLEKFLYFLNKNYKISFHILSTNISIAFEEKIQNLKEQLKYIENEQIDINRNIEELTNLEYISTKNMSNKKKKLLKKEREKKLENHTENLSSLHKKINNLLDKENKLHIKLDNLEIEYQIFKKELKNKTLKDLDLLNNEIYSTRQDQHKFNKIIRNTSNAELSMNTFRPYFTFSSRKFYTSAFVFKSRVNHDNIKRQYSNISKDLNKDIETNKDLKSFLSRQSEIIKTKYNSKSIFFNFIESIINETHTNPYSAQKKLEKKIKKKISFNI